MIDGQALAILYLCRIYSSNLLWDGSITQPKGHKAIRLRAVSQTAPLAKRSWKGGGLQDNLS